VNEPLTDAERSALVRLPRKCPERLGRVADDALCPTFRSNTVEVSHGCACSGACLRDATPDELRAALARMGRTP
jgi:hypothetical protein